MDKSRVLDAVRERLRQELERHERASAKARADATDEDNKAEGKYDTRGLEASYLARGHALQVQGVVEAIQILGSFFLPRYDSGKPAGPGALIEVQVEGETMIFFLLPCAGGIEVEVEGCDTEITVVTPESPVAEQLDGKRAGEGFRVRAGAPEGAVVRVW